MRHGGVRGPPLDFKFIECASTLFGTWEVEIFSGVPRNYKSNLIYSSIILNLTAHGKSSLSFKDSPHVLNALPCYAWHAWHLSNLDLHSVSGCQT
jgi:hypothetical protein